MILDQYFYLIGIIILLPVWLALFENKQSRVDMILVGITLGILALVVDYFYASVDYWKPVYLFPNFHLEDILYGFIFGGISSELYKIVLKLRNSVESKYPVRKNFSSYLL